MRRKGKVHPSPPPPPPSSSSVSSASAAVSSHPPSTNKDAMSFLKLLPATILAILSILSHEDREVLGYMISRSIKATNFLSSDLIQENSKKSSKKLASTMANSSTHKTPTFDCDCFDCYTSYWFKWDSSPNREVIHQAIEAFEEEYFLGSKDRIFQKGSKNKHNKKKDKMGRRGIGKLSDFEAIIQSPPAFQELGFLEKVSSAIPPPPSPQSEPPAVAATDEMVSEESRKSVELLKAVTLNKDMKNPESPEHDEVVVLRGGGNNEKGLARKVLPDVLGLFSSRLWNLWGPNV